MEGHGATEGDAKKAKLQQTIAALERGEFSGHANPGVANEVRRAARGATSLDYVTQSVWAAALQSVRGMGNC